MKIRNIVFTCILCILLCTLISASAEFRPGTIVEFGHYEQDADTSNGAEPIQWVVLESTDNSIKLISTNVLDYRQWNSKANNTKWSGCALRKWLNGQFYNSAFSNAEKQSIVATKTMQNTNDKVSLLSESEAVTYFPSSIYSGNQTLYKWYLAKPTLFAEEAGSKALKEMGLSSTRVDSALYAWWLIDSDETVATLGGSGTYSSFQTRTVLKDYTVGAVRPVVSINVKKAETVLKVTTYREVKK